MTAFNEREHAMMRGIWGELEMMNRSLTGLLELLERQPQPQVARDACIMPSCPNPRFTNSGHCHHHRYLRGAGG